MGIGKKAKNLSKTAEGKTKKVTGEATSNESLKAKGKAEQVKGDAKQAAEKTKDTFKH
nr:CsbD family protein [Streptomyces sp. RPT161]